MPNLTAALLVLLSFPACHRAPAPPAGDRAAPEAASETSEAPETPRPEPTVERSSVARTWTSPSCGERTYVREIGLLESGRFRARDLVAPCPPDARCIWSGIVIYDGTWTQDDTGIALTVDTDEAAPQGQPFPARLGLDAAGGAVFESGPDGPCLYE